MDVEGWGGEELIEESVPYMGSVGGNVAGGVWDRGNLECGEKALRGFPGA
jgi:hypothetical protein